jgi:adenylylsulfate kinase
MERDLVRSHCLERDIPFMEVHISTTLETCERRDTKGLYKKARAGLIPQFTGIDSPYEEPLAPELVIPTEDLTVQESVDLLMDRMLRFGK